MTDESPYDIQRQIAADILTKAGDRAATARKGFGVSEKPGADYHDIVTTVNTTVQREVLAALTRIFPEYGFLAEGARRDAEFRWVLDPIDGTKNFARGLPLWGLSLALLHRNQAVVGAITIPDNAETYSASLGGAAFRNGVPIAVSKPRPLAASIVAMTWGKNVDQRSRMLAAVTALVPRASDVLSVGAASVALSWLAAGRVDAVVDNGDIWDFAAGFMIAKQMGALVTEWDGSRPTYKERDFYTLVSTNQPLHDELVAILKER
jgi:myo-inositol-1(or 4)-monophosphatase